MTREGLIAALEAADGPSRALDMKITEYSKSMALFGTVGTDHLPFYTSSIDAALTLVPTGVFWCVGRYGAPDDEPGHAYSAIVDHPRYYNHNHPAIAICIAALRAMEGVK